MKKLVAIILLLFTNSSFAQTHAIDSLKVLLKDNFTEGTARIDALNEFTYQIRRFSWDSTLVYANTANALSKEIAYKRGEAFSNINLGSYYLAKAAYAKSLEHALNASAAFEGTNDQVGLMRSYLLLGITYRQLSETQKAEKYLKHSLTLASKLQDNEEIARAYNSLGLIAQDQGDTHRALLLFLSALKSTKENSHIKVMVLTNVGALHIQNKDLDRALNSLNEALQIAIALDDKPGQTYVHIKLGTFFKEKGEQVKAESHFLIAEKLSRQVDDRIYRLEVYNNLADINLRANKEIGKEYLIRYYALKDSLSDGQKAQQIAELQERYEGAKREQTIELLKKEKQIQRSWQISLIVGILLIIVASVFIYVLQRSQTQKIRKLLGVQQQLNEKLKEVNKLNSRFFANVSHEFRTPLTLILAPLEEAQKSTSISDHVRELLFLMDRNARRLLELVNQLLDLSKLEAGKMELRVKQGNLDSFLNVITSSFDSLAQHKQVKFEKTIEVGDQPLWFDPDTLEKIINNLLANAFKFTSPQGIVTFEAVLGRSGDSGNVSIVVSDNGKGIPVEEQAYVFSPFYQAKMARGSIPSGTGIGLALVSELIKLYGGTISFKSEVSKGTSFNLTLPVLKGAFTPTQAVEVQNETSYVPSRENHISSDDYAREDQDQTLIGKDSVLIAEDNKDLLNFVASKLKNQFTVYTATNGEEALLLALRVVPNLVLCDLMMPKMDGIQLTERLKADERTCHIPVVLLTAKSEQQSKIAGLRTGADDYMTKPFSTEELFIRITNLIEQRKKLAERFRERILVNPTPSTDASMDDRFILKVRDIIEGHMSDFTFTVEQLADEANLSRTQLLRKLKALTGLSSNEFIKDLRLKRAADMISQKIDTITQIGYSVGFNDQSYFTKCFKKQFGVTPTEYSLQSTTNKKKTPLSLKTENSGV